LFRSGKEVDAEALKAYEALIKETLKKLIDSQEK